MCCVTFSKGNWKKLLLCMHEETVNAFEWLPKAAFLNHTVMCDSFYVCIFLCGFVNDHMCLVRLLFDGNLALFSSGVVFVVSKGFHSSTGSLWLVLFTGCMQHPDLQVCHVAGSMVNLYWLKLPAAQAKKQQK